MQLLTVEDESVVPGPLVRISRGKLRIHGDFVAGLDRHTLALGFLHADAKRHHCRKGAHEFVDSVRDHCRISSQFALMPGISRSEEHTSELQSLMRIPYAVFCLKKTKSRTTNKR